MSSSRLPGKVLATLAGRPMLEFVVRRLQAAQSVEEVIVATSTSPADDAVSECCHRLGVRCFRGSEFDVLSRYVAATADLGDDDIVVRATADNPLYCPIRTAAIIAEHRRLAADYTCIDNLSYVVPEVMRAGALRAMAAVATDARCREHVTPYFREAPNDFNVVKLPADWMGLRPDIRLTVDTAEELERMAAICERLARRDLLVPLEEVYATSDEMRIDE
jgi:spore coat polysaccharide biosynthesis protein SpsF